MTPNKAFHATASLREAARERQRWAAREFMAAGIRALVVTLLFAGLSGCMFGLDYSGTKDWRTEECESLRGQEQDRCYAAVDKTEEEYEHEREQSVKDE